MDFTRLSGSDESGLVIVLGPNGSGKTITAVSILAALSGDARRMQVCDDLRSVGIERISLEAFTLERHLTISVDVGTGAREFHWREPAGENHANGRQGAAALIPNEALDSVPELFSSVHMVIGGRLSLPPLPDLTHEFVKSICAPIEHELAGWIQRERNLSGSDIEHGRLAQSLSQLAQAESELSRVENLWKALKQNQDRQSDLLSRIDSQRRERDVHIAEIEEYQRLSTWADRAARLESWIQEIETENRRVMTLRDQHVLNQTRLDGLEEQFRGVADNFPQIAEDYGECHRRIRELSEQLAELNRLRDTAHEKIAELHTRLSSLEPPPDRADELARLSEEESALNDELTTLLRGRIELIRRREGAHLAIQQEYPEFAERDPRVRATLDRIAASGEEIHSVRPSATSDVKQQAREKRVLEVRTMLAEQFSGFAALPSRTPEMLRDLYDLRHVHATYRGDLDSLRRRHSMLQRRTHPIRSVLASIIIGAAGFGGVTAWAGWDIGLFAGIACSGLTLLALRALHRKSVSELESAAAAETMLQSRADEAAGRIKRLEQTVGVAAGPKSIEEALTRWTDFQKLTIELESRSQAPEEDAAVPPRDDASSVVEGLPDSLRALALPVLREQYARFVAAEQLVRELDRQWSDYADGGSIAEQIRALEDQAAEIRRRESEIAAQIRTDQENFLAQKRELTAELASLEAQSDLSEQELRLQAAVDLWHNKAFELEEETGGLLRRHDLTALRGEWQERETIRAKLREIRNELSAHNTYDELRAREALLKEEMSDVNQRLAARDPLYLLQGNAADHATKYRAQLRAVEQTVTECDARLRDMQTEFDALDINGQLAALSEEPALDQLQHDIAERRTTIEEIERDLHTTRELIASVRSELEDTRRTAPDLLGSQIDKIVRELSGGRFLSVRFDNDQWYVDGADGNSRRVSSHSDGTQDLLWIAARIAVLESLRSADRNPVIWDEPLTRLDEDRAARALVMLQNLAADRQVILLSRQTSLESWGHVLRFTGEFEWSSISPP